MKFGNVRVIALKEFRDVLRDRRTLIFMMLLPVAVMPLLMLGLTKFMVAQKRTKSERPVTLAMEPATHNALVALGLDWIENNPDHWAGWKGAPLVAVAKHSGLGEELRKRLSPDSEPSGDDEFPPEVQRGLDDAKAVERILEKAEFVDLADVAGAGALAAGVEIPPAAPQALQDTRLAVAIQDKEIDAAVYLAPDALATLEAGEGVVEAWVLHDSSITMSDEAADRLLDFLDVLGRSQLALRVAEIGLPPHFTEPLRAETADVATKSRKVQAMLGGLLPYLLLAFCFMGAFYPALDVTAGEKERFTLETVLLAPTSRFEIALGKFIVVFIAAIVAALLTTTSMAVTFTQGILPPELAEAFDLRFEPLALALTASMILPVAALYAAMLLAVGLFARSFKEAQSYAMPLQFLCVLPSMVSLIPDLETESYLAWIPFVNISLLMKELLKGNYLWSFYAITIVSTLVLTLGALVFAAWTFRRESVLLRT